MAELIAVVIPFYQRKSGILRKSVLSALAQQGDFEVRVVIVDDASPVSARSEIADLLETSPERFVLIEQANTGPAAARNRALENVPASTEYVAFLDSDDEWIVEHLANALQVLNTGDDFYFADHYQINQSVSAFKRAGRIKPDSHPSLPGARYLHHYAGNMFDQIIDGNVVGTSTVVYRWAKFPLLRFREEFVYAGEDYLFWMELAKLTSHVGFSEQVECTYGEGVNIFAGSGWGTEKSLIRLHYEMKFKRVLPRLFSLTTAQLVSNRASVKQLRQMFVADVLHRVMHRKPVPISTLIAQFRIDPGSLLWFIPLAVRVVLKR